jgi:hypothetical protein
MKKLLFMFSVVLMLTACGNSNQGELVGVRKSNKTFNQPDPYGMVFVPQGSYTMGVGGEDITGSYLNEPKTVSVSAFFMDETEITNNEYRQFVYWVRDSIARRILADNFPDKYAITESKSGEVYDPPRINWKEKIDWNSKEQEVREALEPMYLPEHERYSVVRRLTQESCIIPISGLTWWQQPKKTLPMTSWWKTTIHWAKPMPALMLTVRVHGRTVSKVIATVRSMPALRSSMSIPTPCAGFTTIAIHSTTR